MVKLLLSFLMLTPLSLQIQSGFNSKELFNRIKKKL